MSLSCGNQIPAFEDFGAVNNLGPGVGNNVTFVNTTGFHSIGFQLTIPVGGMVAFQGSYDGVIWVEHSVIALSSFGYEFATPIDGPRVASISALKFFRVTVIAPGGSFGTVIGRASRELSVLEGSTRAPAPHQIGYKCEHIGFEFTVPTTAGIVGIALPPIFRFVLTDLAFTVEGSGFITMFDEINDSFHWIFRGEFKLPANQTQFVNQNFSTPFVSATGGNRFLVTTTNTIITRGVFHGYIIPNTGIN